MSSIMEKYILVLSTSDKRLLKKNTEALENAGISVIVEQMLMNQVAQDSYTSITEFFQSPNGSLTYRVLVPNKSSQLALKHINLISNEFEDTFSNYL